MKRYLIVLFVVAVLTMNSCGGGSGSSSVTPIDVNTLDGQTDVATDLPFRYTFTGTVDTSTVTTTSYFIVETPSSSTSISGKRVAKAAFDPATCDVANALSATVSTGTLSDANSYADLTPSASLSGSAGYTVCLTAEITVGGTAITAFQASFNSKGGGGTQTDRLRITNSCSYAIWIQQQNMPSDVPSVVKLDAGESHDWMIPDAGQASTRFWPKAGCDGNGQNCTIGQSSDPCTNCPPPVDSKLEATWGCTLSTPSLCGTTPQGDRIGDTYWNMSAVDGYTLPFTASVTGNTVTDSGSPCEAVDCSGLSFSQCPASANLSEGRGVDNPAYSSVNLAVENTSSVQIGCYSPCKKFNYPTYGGYGLDENNPQAIMYCCPTPDATDAACEADPANCVTAAQCRAGPGATDSYVTAIHTMCNNTAYGYAYDDNYGLRHCSAGTLVHVTFGPDCP